jgi:hypothetical protein
MKPVKRVMRLSTALLVIGAQAAAAVAQQRPDFSGRWQLVPDTSAASRSVRSTPTFGSGWASDISIAQDATTLTIEFSAYTRYDMQPPTRLVYRLDGAESTNTINVGRGPQEQISTAAWDGARLTLTTVRRFSAAPGEKPTIIRTTQTLWLDAAAMLAVETTHEAALGGSPSTRRSIYKKN